MTISGEEVDVQWCGREAQRIGKGLTTWLGARWGGTWSVVGWRSSRAARLAPCVWDTRSGRMLSRPRGRLHERPINGPRMRPKIFRSRTKLKGIPFFFSIFKIWHWNTVSNIIFFTLKFLWQFGDKLKKNNIISMTILVPPNFDTKRWCQFSNKFKKNMALKFLVTF